MTPDISVIIPLYNAKDYVFYTIDSLLNQTKKELEILLVDDCSTDGSAELVEDRYQSDSRVRVIRQAKNGGPGVARNTGIEQAAGTYITFCDSDDQIKPDCYEKMYEVARQYDADVVHAGGCLISMMENTPMDMLKVQDEDWCACDCDHPATKETALLTEPQEVIFEKWKTHAFHWAIWNKLIRRSLLMEHNVRFGKMRLAEDEEFCLNILFRAQRYVVMPGFWYCYRQVADSACRGKYDIRFLVKSLTAAFEATKGLKDLSDIPFFKEHPAKLDEAAENILEGLEVSFLRPVSLALGEETIRQSSEVRKVFETYLGDLAAWGLKSFAEAHRNLPKEDDFMKMVNSPAGMRKLVEMGIFHNLKQVNEEKAK